MISWAFVLACLGVILSGSSAAEPKYFEWDTSSSKFVTKSVELPPDSPSLQDGFQTKILQEKFKVHSQSGQDFLVMNNLFNDTSNRYFVDLAANDWKELSNTFILEQYNMWKGVCIEPNPKYLKGLLGHRRCKVFVNPVAEKIGEKVKFVFDDAFGGIVGNDFDNKNEHAQGVAELTTVTLDSILDTAEAPKVIDYFSLDVEGAEYHVMQNFRFDKYTFLSLTIERPIAKLHHLLVDHGYRFVYSITDFGDTLYLHHTIPNFEHLMEKMHLGRMQIGWMSDKQTHYLLAPKWDGHYVPHTRSHNAVDAASPT